MKDPNDFLRKIVNINIIYIYFFWKEIIIQYIFLYKKDTYKIEQ